MSTIVRRRRASRMTLGPYKRHELLGGRIVYPVLGYDGYGDGSSTNVADFIGPEMRADWQANRVALIDFWNRDRARTFSLTVCLGCTRIESPAIPLGP